MILSAGLVGAAHQGNSTDDLNHNETDATANESYVVEGESYSGIDEEEWNWLPGGDAGVSTESTEDEKEYGRSASSGFLDPRTGEIYPQESDSSGEVDPQSHWGPSDYSSVPGILPPNGDTREEIEENQLSDRHLRTVRVSMWNPPDGPQIDPPSSFCTGSMISEYHVLTAAHCVYNGTADQYKFVNNPDADIDSTFVEPGLYNAGFGAGTVRPRHYANVTDMRVYPEYSDSGGGHDIAILTLDRPIGEETGSWGYIYPGGGSDEYRQEAHSLGYPGKFFSHSVENAPDAGGNNLAESDGEGDGTGGAWWDPFNHNRLHKVEMDLSRGMSGGPIYKSDQSTILSVVKSGNLIPYADREVNNGTRITQNKHDFIQNTISSSTEPPSKPDLFDGGEFEYWERDNLINGQAEEDLTSLNLVNGEEITLEHFVHNVGLSSVSNPEVAYYLSDNPSPNTAEWKPNEDIKIGETTAGSIDPFGRSTVTWSGELNVEPGRYTLIRVIDPDDKIDEYTEAHKRDQPYMVEAGIRISEKETTLTASPDSWDLGSVSPGSTRQRSITIENTGDVSTEVAVSGGSGLSFSGVPNQLDTGESDSFTVTLDAGSYNGDSIAVSYAGGSNIIPVSANIVDDGDLIEEDSEQVDDIHSCRWVTDVWGPDSPESTCDEEPYDVDFVDEHIGIDSEAMNGFSEATLQVEFATDPLDDAQDDPLNVYLNGEQIASFDSPPGGGDSETRSVSVSKNDLQVGDNTVRLSTIDRSAYVIGSDTELQWEYFKPPELELSFGQHPEEIEPGTTFSLNVNVENEGGRAAEDVNLGISDFDAALEVTDWPDGWGSGGRTKTLEPGESDIGHFEIKLTESTSARGEIAAIGDNFDTETDSFTVAAPNDPPTLDSFDVSPGEVYPSEQVTYTASVSDPDGDDIDVTLEVYIPSDGSWQTYGTQTVSGSGTVQFDVSPFSGGDIGETAKFRFGYSDDFGHNGEWGSFVGPDISSPNTERPSFEDWSYPTEIGPTDDTEVSVEISDPDGVASAGIEYTYPDGSEGQKDMSQTGSTWSATIPAPTGDTDGQISFAVSATDDNNFPKTSESVTRYINIEEDSIPPDYQLSNLNPTDATVTQGDGPIDVSVDVSNAGGEPGNQDIDLEVVEDGTGNVVYSATRQGVQIPANGATTVTFNDVPAGSLSLGDYTHTVTSENDTISGSLTVSDGSNTPPTASFTYAPSNPEVEETVNFDASSSDDSDGTITSYEWDFGDGVTSTGETASHSYSSSGDYTVSLTVTDDDGATDTISKTVSVSGDSDGNEYVYHVPFTRNTQELSAGYTSQLRITSQTNGTVIEVDHSGDGEFDDNRSIDTGEQASFSDPKKGATVRSTSRVNVTYRYASADFGAYEDDNQRYGVPEQNLLGTEYYLPIDANDIWVAAPTPTTIEVDTDGDGSYEKTESVPSNGAIKISQVGSGTHVTADNPVHIVAERSRWSNMDYTYLVSLLPVENTPSSYEIPSEPDYSRNSPTSKTGVYLAGTQTGTSVEVDIGDDGNTDRQLTLGEGEVSKIETTEASTVTADAPVTAVYTYHVAAEDPWTSDRREYIGALTPVPGINFNQGSWSGTSESAEAWSTYGIEDSESSVGRDRKRGVAYHNGYGYTTGDGKVKKFDMDTREVVNSFDVPDGSRSLGLAYGGGSLWFADGIDPAYDGEIIELNPNTGDVRSRIDTSYDPTGLAFGGGSLWVADITLNNIIEYDTNGKRVSSFDLPTNSPQGLAYFDGSVWLGDYCYGGSGCTASLYEFDTDGTLKQETGERDLDGERGGYGGLATTDIKLLGPDTDGSVTVLRTLEDGNTEPTAGLTFTPSSPSTLDTITFDGSTSSDSDGSVQSYEWEFGDGTTATGQTATHSYSSSGDYTVTLTVTDDDGATDTTTRTVSVSSVQAGATITSGSVTVGSAGDTGESSITIDAEDGMSAADVEVSVDTSAAEITNVAPGADVDTGDPAVAFDVVDQTPDSVLIQYTNIQSLTGQITDFELATVEFEAQTDDGETPISLSNTAVFDADSDQYSVINEEEGTLTVGALFEDPMPGFNNPPQNTDELHPTLYEDLDGDGDGTDVDGTVRAFGKLIRGRDLGLTDEQARKFDWAQDSPETEVTPGDMVSLFGEQIRAR